ARSPSEPCEHRVSPQTPLQSRLVSLWQEVLKRAPVSIDDNFFDLGGHSLLAARLQSRLQQAGIELGGLQVLFEHPTIAQLAAWLEQQPERWQEPASQLDRGPSPIAHGSLVPASSEQQRLWFLEHLLPQSGRYHIPITLRWPAQVNVACLQAALTAVIERHESLRTVFREDEGGLWQVIEPQMPIDLSVVEITEPATSQEERVREGLQVLASFFARRFALSEGPLLRAQLVRWGAQETVLAISVHHIIFDGYSQPILEQEVRRAYAALLRGEALHWPSEPLQYADYVLWQQQRLTAAQQQQRQQYWREALQGAPQVLSLPTDRPRPHRVSGAGGWYRHRLAERVSAGLRAYAHREQVTPFMVMLAGYAVLLGRYSGQEEVVIGVPVANREREEVEGVIGFLVNTLPMRIEVQGKQPFGQLVQQVRRKILQGQEQQLPFEQVVEVVQAPRTLSHNPIFQVMFSDQGLQTLGRRQEEIGETPLSWEYKLIETMRASAKFDLSLSMHSSQDDILCWFEYSTDLFEQDTIIRMAQHLEIVLLHMIAYPDQKLSTVSLLTMQEKEIFLKTYKATQSDLTENYCVHQLFEHQVRRTPDAIAVVDEEGQITYQELERRSELLAVYLRQQGVEPGVQVAVCLQRSVNLVIALLGILKAGGAYVPLDPTYPIERLAFMVEEAHVQVLLTQRQLATTLPMSRQQILCLDSDWMRLVTTTSSQQLVDADVNNLMYVIFTSGSTGKPKGVGVYHRGFINLLHWFTSTFDIGIQDRTLLISSIGFDLTQKNIYAPLITGGTLILTIPDRYDAHQIVYALYEQQITLLNCTPSAFYPLIEYDSQSVLARQTFLRSVFLGGEPIALSRLHRWREETCYRVEILNTYGPTECTDIVASYHLPKHSENSLVPIGRPITNTHLFILDEQQQPVPTGIVGELYAAGAGIGMGYINDSGLTAQKFLPDPFSGIPGARMYRTGDLARYHPDGNIEYLGRIDHQMKFRGYRIEPGEIEE